MLRSRSCFQTRGCDVATSRRAPCRAVRSFAATLAVYLALGAVGAPRARACDEGAQARPDSTCVVMSRQGVRGVWFRLAEADELRKATLLVPQLSLQIQQYSDLDKKRAEQVTALEGALAARTAVNDALKLEVGKAVQAASAAQADAMAAREELSRWWRSGFVWLTVGALAGALAGIAIAH